MIGGIFSSSCTNRQPMSGFRAQTPNPLIFRIPAGSTRDSVGAAGLSRDRRATTSRWLRMRPLPCQETRSLQQDLAGQNRTRHYHLAGWRMQIGETERAAPRPGNNDGDRRAGGTIRRAVRFKEINPMELIYITSQDTHYNLARLLTMQYQPSKEEIMEGEIIMLEGDRRFDDRKRTGRFKSTSQLRLTFSTEPLDCVHLTGEEADKVYEEIINMSRLSRNTTAR